MPGLALGRRGLTLVELLVAMALLGVVSTGIYGVLVSSQRTSHAQAQRIDLQQNLRAAASLLPAELRELDASEGDIAALSPTSMTIRAMRQLAIVCRRPALGGALSGVGFVVRAAPFFGSRDFNPATDSLLIYYEGDEGTRQDDGWVLARLTAVGAQNCGDGTPGRRLTANLLMPPPQWNLPGVVPNGAPVRGFEWVTYRVYQAADAQWYLGLQSGGDTQPLVGPLSGGTGLTFTYYDSAGVVTGNPAHVAEIEIVIRGITAQPIHHAGSLSTTADSLVTRVALRNNRRF
ncbi:MAG: PulJ/GspJ family protein [Gemmatimonadales bacterium]